MRKKLKWNNKNAAYQNGRTNEHDICEEVSWLRESWRCCLELASICVHCMPISKLLWIWVDKVADKSMYRRGCRDQAQLWGRTWTHAIVVEGASGTLEGRIWHSILIGFSCRPEWRVSRHQQPTSYTNISISINMGRKQRKTYLEMGGAAQKTSVADMMICKCWWVDNEALEAREAERKTKVASLRA